MQKIEVTAQTKDELLRKLLRIPQSRHFHRIAWWSWDLPAGPKFLRNGKMLIDGSCNGEPITQLYEFTFDPNACKVTSMKSKSVAGKAIDKLYAEYWRAIKMGMELTELPIPTARGKINREPPELRNAIEVLKSWIPDEGVEDIARAIYRKGMSIAEIVNEARVRCSK